MEKLLDAFRRLGDGAPSKWSPVASIPHQAGYRPHLAVDMGPVAARAALDAPVETGLGAWLGVTRPLTLEALDARVLTVAVVISGRHYITCPHRLVA